MIPSQHLVQLSQMVINGEITHKIDQIATIYINGRHYFNVFRRYNSPYNIVIEDMNGDIYLHQDHTVRTSMKTVLCLPDYEAGNIYTLNTTSYKHNGPPPSTDWDIADMRWSEIQAKYHAVSVNFGGIFYNIDYNPPIQNDVMDDVPSTPRDQMIPPPQTPNAPERPKVTKEDKEAANILLTLCIPRTTDAFHISESDRPTLSMRFADVARRKRVPICYCEMDSDDDHNDNYEEDD